MTEKADEAPSDQALADLLKLPVQLVQMMRKSDQPATSVVAQEKPVQPEAAQAAQAEPPLAKGSDEWWAAAAKEAAKGADIAEMERRAREDFQRARAETYIETGGRTDIGGFVDQHFSPWARGRAFDWRHMPPGGFFRRGGWGNWGR